jgi:immunoglobulin-like protein involved in spore germination
MGEGGQELARREFAGHPSDPVMDRRRLALIALALSVTSVLTSACGRPRGTVTEDSLIRVTSPTPGSSVTSPLRVRGEARGTYYFEASFPVRLLDANGREIAITPVQAQGEWMTDRFVPFEGMLEFPPPSPGTRGVLVFEKDNPSGDPKYAHELRIPVRFGKPSQ